MKTLLELQENRSYLVKSSRDIVEKAKNDSDRALTTEEQADLVSLQRDICSLDKEILDRQTLDKFDAVTAHQMDALEAKPRQTAPAAPDNSGEGPKPRVRSYGERHAKLKAFKGPDAERNAFRSGMFIRAALFGDEKARRWCRHDGLDYRAQAVGVNASGGFLVPNDFSAAIIDLREEYGVFRRECDVMPMSRDLMLIPRKSDSGTAAFVGENTALAESDVAFNQVTLTAHKLGRITRMSTEIAEDAVINMADWLAREFAWSFALKEDQTGFIGDGTASFAGIRGTNVKIIDGTHTAGAVDATSGNDAFGNLDALDLDTLIGKVPGFALANAKFYCSSLAAALVFGRFQAAAGGNTIETLQGPTGRSYLGFPIVVSQVFPMVTTALNNLVMLLFGDMTQAATLGDRREITIGTSTDRYFVEDQIAIKATERIDINVHDLGDNTTAGPIVALIGNT